MLVIIGLATIYVALLVVTGDSGIGDKFDQVLAWAPLVGAGISITALAVVAMVRQDRRYLLGAIGVALALIAYVVLVTWVTAE